MATNRTHAETIVDCLEHWAYSVDPGLRMRRRELLVMSIEEALNELAVARVLEDALEDDQ